MFVLERLATFATNHTDAALACLELLVQSDNILWSIDSWKKNAWIVLSSAFANASSNGRARELVNELGRRGFQEYRSLLGGGNPGT
jgi:hypothetical protein